MAGNEEKTKHSKLIEIIKSNPDRIGLNINDIVMVLQEAEHLKCDMGRYLRVRAGGCAPDLLFFLRGGRYIVVEFTTKRRKFVKKLGEQLKNDFDYFKRYHNTECEVIGIYLGNDRPKMNLKQIEKHFEYFKKHPEIKCELIDVRLEGDELRIDNKQRI